MKKQPIKNLVNYILLNPLQPSFFGLDDSEVSTMISELEDVGVKVMLVDTEKEMFFYAYSPNKTLLEALCTNYGLGGLLVESHGVFDQVIQSEVV